MAFRPPFRNWHRGAPQQPHDCIRTGVISGISYHRIHPYRRVIDQRVLGRCADRAARAGGKLGVAVPPVPGWLDRALFVPGHLDRVTGCSRRAAPASGCSTRFADTCWRPFVTRENFRVKLPPRFVATGLVGCGAFFHPMGADIGAVDRGWLGRWADADSSWEVLPYALLVQNLVLPLSAPAATQCGGHCQSSSTSTCCCHCFLQSSAPSGAPPPYGSDVDTADHPVAVEIAWRQLLAQRSVIRVSPIWLPLLVNCRVFCPALPLASRPSAPSYGSTRGDSRGIAANGLSFWASSLRWQPSWLPISQQLLAGTGR